MGIKLDKDPLIVEQNNYLPKIVHIYLVYDLDAKKLKGQETLVTISKLRIGYLD